jgi:hypothetical protein
MNYIGQFWYILVAYRSWGRCYDHNFLHYCQFSATKLAFFKIKNQCYDHIFAKNSSSLSKNANFFAKFFAKNISKIITSVPGRDRTNLAVKWLVPLGCPVDKGVEQDKVSGCHVLPGKQVLRLWFKQFRRKNWTYLLLGNANNWK